MEKNGKTMVTEVDQLVSEAYKQGFFDSCKDVKFGPSNANAMDFIGGGASTPGDFVKFLGDEKAIGSPFQINFPESYSEPDMAPREMAPRKCSDEDPNFRCACIDCPEVCPELAPVKEGKSCRVGVLPCLSFASILTYGILLLSFAGVIVGRIAWRRHATRRTERLRLLRDAAPSDDEDEADLAESDLLFSRPQRHYRLNTWCDAAFSKLGHAAARFPAITIVSSLVVVAILSIGWVRFDLERDRAAVG